MARMQSVGREGFAFPVRGFTAIRRQDLAHFLPTEQTLRRSIPLLFLFIVFVGLTVVGASVQFLHTKTAALEQARERLSLTADAIAATMRSSGVDDGNSSSWQRELARNLPTGATLQGRRVVISDLDGDVQASAPLSVELIGRPLQALLGPDTALTLFGAQAGVLEVTLANGRRALVAARNLAEPGAQIAVIQLIEDALRQWRRDVTFDATMLSTMTLVLLLVGGAFWMISARSAEAASSSAVPDSALDATLAAAGFGLWDWNIARGRVQWSQTMYDVLGRKEPIQPLSFRDVTAAVHRDDDLYGSADQAVRNGAQTFDRSIRMRHSDGHWMPMRLRGRLIRLGGEPHLVAVACPTDHVTKLVEAADMRLTDAVEALPEAFVLWDAENRLLMCNSKYREFHQLAEEVAIPGTPYEKIIAASAQPVERRRTPLANGNSNDAQSYETQFDDGRWLRVNERRTKDGGYVSIGTDITDLKLSEQRLFEREGDLEATVADLRQSRRKLEQQKQQLVDMAEKYHLEKNRAEAANRSKSEFLANMSHELRTPLNAVIGFSEVMRDSLFGPIGNEKYEEYARDIHTSGCYLLDVINDILDMSKIEAGRMTLNVEPIDVAAIIADSLPVVSQSAQEKGITLKRSGLKELEVKADRRALKQVLINLLSNAVKFTPEGGRVTVKLARRAEGRCSIAIADTGVGIPEHKLGKLGRPFEQVENQFSKSRSGSGLGLAISRSLLEMHGGHLEISSREGKGTTVTCVLPLRPVLAVSEDAGPLDDTRIAT